MSKDSSDPRRGLTGFCAVLFALAYVVLGLLTPFGPTDFELAGLRIPALALTLTGVALPILSSLTRRRTGSQVLCFVGAGLVFVVSGLWVVAEFQGGPPRINWHYHGAACLFGAALLLRGAWGDRSRGRHTLPTMFTE
ncbi:hypothetical protein [Planctomycetes bacterium Poly30]